MKIAAFRKCRPGSMIGLPDIRPSSFANAMIEPVKVSAPTATPIAISISDSVLMCSGVPMLKASGA